MVEIQETSEYARWFDALTDLRARQRIRRRIDRLADGNPGDVRPVGEGVSDLRIDYGPGYRVYYIRRGTSVLLLLAGGDKRTQAQDIRTALAIARER